MKFYIAIISTTLLSLTVADVSHLSSSYLPPHQPERQYIPPAPQPQYLPPVPLQLQYIPPAPPQPHYVPPAPQPQYLPPAPPQPHYVPPAPQPQYLPPQEHYSAPPAPEYIPPPVQPESEYLPPTRDAPPAHVLADDGYHYRSPLSYKNYLRMDKEKFDMLLDLVRSDLERSDTIMREAVTAEEKLAVTLRFIATGESFTSLNYQTRLSTSLISQTIPEVCESLFKRLKEKHLKFPKCTEDWEAIAKQFAIKWQFPNCIGALDGKHIQLRPKRNNGAFYHNYKGTNSIILLALVDANLRFIFVDVGCNGRVNDAGVLQRSQLRHVFDDESQLPRDSAVGNSGCLPYVVVADDAFPLQRHIMKPYSYRCNNEENKIFNLRLAFGVLSNRFRVFQTAMNLKVETVEIVTLACIVLHNFLIDVDENYVTNFQQSSIPMDASVQKVIGAPYNPRKGASEHVRQKFMQYFTGEGKLDWQYS